MAIARARYHFVTDFSLVAPSTQVWDALMDFSSWKDWWKAVRDIKVERAEYPQIVRLSIGVAFYILRFRLVMTSVEERELAAFASEGDLAGDGTIVLSEALGTTRVVFTWDVETTKPWMNALVVVLRPVFMLCHDFVMRLFVNGLARKLGAEVVERHSVSQ